MSSYCEINTCAMIMKFYFYCTLPYNFWGRGANVSVSIVSGGTEQTTEISGFDFHQEKNFYFLRTPKLAPNHSLIHWVKWAASQVLNWLKSEASYPPASSAEVNNAYIYTSPFSQVFTSICLSHTQPKWLLYILRHLAFKDAPLCPRRAVTCLVWISG